MATSLAEALDGLPSEFQLEKNYPNAFNPSTAIRFSLVACAHVAPHIFDAAGREVPELVDEVGEAGSHEVLFKAGTPPSVLSCYRQQAGEQIAARKFILVRKVKVDIWGWRRGLPQQSQLNQDIGKACRQALSPAASLRNRA